MCNINDKYTRYHISGMQYTYKIYILMLFMPTDNKVCACMSYYCNVSDT